MRRRPKLKEVFVRLEDHLECVCTSQHQAVENSEAETGKKNKKNISNTSFWSVCELTIEDLQLFDLKMQTFSEL